MEDRLYLLPTLRRHPDFAVLSSRPSQALANLHSRLRVVGETPMTSAASSRFRPAKKRSSIAPPDRFPPRHGRSSLPAANAPPSSGFRRAEFAAKPGFGQSPFAFEGSRRNTHDFRQTRMEI